MPGIYFPAGDVSGIDGVVREVLSSEVLRSEICNSSVYRQFYMSSHQKAVWWLLFCANIAAVRSKAPNGVNNEESSCRGYPFTESIQKW